MSIGENTVNILLNCEGIRMEIDRIASMINDGKWEEASVELEKLDKHNDRSAILEAAIAEHNGKYEKMFESIRNGLQYNYTNYELYVMLGNYYRETNINKTYLCYETALYYCNNENDRKYISDCLDELKNMVKVHPCSIVIVSYNNKKLLVDCIDSIKKNNYVDSYELIVVDNASTDGVREWLTKQNKIVVVYNDENKGFGFACNQGVKHASENNDILFLNNDTIVMPNSLFWLRMGLYDSESVGATGSVSNFVGNDQHIRQKFSILEDYEKFAQMNNIPERNATEIKIWLSGFAVLVKRKALDAIGLFDLRYGNGYYEDNDLGIRLQIAGYKLLLCHNSFIYHYGSKSFGFSRANVLCRENREVFKEKWGFDIDCFTYAQNEIISLISENDYNKEIRILEVGCGCGATLAKIKYVFPNSVVKGIERNEKLARLGSNSLDILVGNVERMELPYEKCYFDYIIMDDIIECFADSIKILEKLKTYLCEKGKILCTVPNIMFASVLIPLLNGDFEYSDDGIINKKAIRFFTYKSIVRLFLQAGFSVEVIEGIKASSNVMLENEYVKKQLNSIMEMPELLNICQFVLKAKLR